jgi:hypothetical protein
MKDKRETSAYPNLNNLLCDVSFIKGVDNECKVHNKWILFFL